MRANQNLKKDRTLIKNVFDALYRKVEENNFEIARFGAQVAKNKKVYFLGDRLKTAAKSKITKEYLFYFCTNGTKLNFILFDSKNNYVEFNTNSIMDLQKILPQQFQVYQAFENSKVKNEKLDELVAENFGQEEVDSDEEDRKKKLVNQKRYSNEDLHKKIKKILGKNIDDIQEGIDEKQAEIQRLMANHRNKDQAEKLSEEVMESQNSLDNFIQTRDSVIIKMTAIQLLTSEEAIIILKRCLKRMILAEKQLESRLPIISRKREIFEKLNKNNLLILEGQTGSGKSTQLPQLLCEFYNVFDRADALPVLITQPRKLATRTLAERVAAEMQESVHGFVDYQTSLTNKVNPNAKIIFKMDRLVLDELKVDPKLSKYCCLVIDEAHERTISIDVILGLIKHLLTIRKDFKIIVTSASMDTQLFKLYFKTQILKVSGRMFEVKEIFEPYQHEKDKTKKIKKLIDDKLLEENQRNLRTQYKGHVLVFCSGVDQINNLTSYYNKKLNPRVFRVHGLHGKLTPDEQRDVFKDCIEHKIIFSTRIAETSITIDKIKVVIDPGEDREMVYDQKTKVTTMQLKNISQSSAKQRAGRAGRTNTGYCFRLYSKKDLLSLSPNKVPEIQNMALDTVVLRLKSLKISNVVQFPYLSPPNKEGLLSSLELMKQLKCLEQKTGDITSIGEFLIKIPIEPFLARSIVQAMLVDRVIRRQTAFINNLKLPEGTKTTIRSMNVVEEVIKILCMIINASNLFRVSAQDRDKADRTKYHKLSDENGDFFFYQKIYNTFYNLYVSRDTQKLRNWSNEHFLGLKTLHQVRELQSEILKIIQSFEIREQEFEFEITEAKAKFLSIKTSQQLIMSCLVSSFSTNLGLYSGNEQIGYTIISTNSTMQLYGTSTLSLQGISPKWILYYDLYENEKGQTYCKVAHSVSFEFLLKHTNPYILKKFNIRESEKKNPFYEKISYQLPSLIFLHIMNDYQRRNYNQNNNNLQFLQRFSINFYEDRNEVEFYYSKSNDLSEIILRSSIFTSLRQIVNSNLNLTNFRESKDPKIVIQGYLKEIKSKYQSGFRYNYVGPIFIELKDGFELFRIDFKVMEHIFRIHCSAFAIETIIYHCHMYGEYERYDDRLVWRIMDEPELLEFQKVLNLLINYFTQKREQFKCFHELNDRRKKIPQAKLFLYFWTGQIKKKNMLLQYKGHHQYDRLNDQDQVNWLQDILNNIHSRKKERNDMLINCQFKLTKKRNAINCFYKGSMDQIQLYQILQTYNKNNQFGYVFSLPKSIKQFREPDLTNSRITDKEWENKIKDLLKKQNMDGTIVVNRVWGREYRDYNSKEGYNVSNFQRMLKIQWFAEIQSFNLVPLVNLQQRYNKKIEILGTEKVHMKFQFQQIITTISSKVFIALKDEFQFVVEHIKNRYPRVTIDYFQKKLRRTTNVYIKIRSEKREQLVVPTQLITKLFRPTLIHLPETEFRFLDKMDEGNDILEEVQSQYKFQIYFAFEKKSFNLKLYCHQYDVKSIQEKLKEKMKKFKVFQREISFRGRNLNRVRQVLDQKIEEIKKINNRNKFLNYEIIFKWRKIRIIGDLNSCDEVENMIMKMIQKEKSNCDICCDLIQRPYKLFTCIHEYCWSCLASYIRGYIDLTGQDQMKCPSCENLMSIHDVLKILSEDEFNKLCDIKIGRKVQTSPEYHCCLSPNCENIFRTQESKKEGSYECELCGKWYCFKCKQSHKVYTCQDWKSKPDDSMLKSMGIKKCPKCGEGIQKNQGCQHITCIKCKAHICWKCLKYFQNQKQCYDHLANQCGGIMV